jgi:hypothetical protein
MMTIEQLEPLQYQNGIMKASWQALFMQAWLSQSVNKAGGVVEILANPKHLWEKIFKCQTEGIPSVLICFNGEISRGDFKQANTLHRVDRQWIVAIIRGHGFNNLMAEGQGQPGTPGAEYAFYDECDFLCDQLRVLINITEEPPIDYKAMEPIPSIAPYGNNGNVFLDGVAIKFSTANDRLAVTDIKP